MSTPDRITIVHPAHRTTCIARLAPMELPRGGVSRFSCSLVFQSEAGDWIGSVSLPIGTLLSDLSPAALLRFLVTAGSGGKPPGPGGGR